MTVGSGTGSGLDEPVGVGLGEGLGDPLGDGDCPPPAKGVGRAAPVGGAGVAGGRGRRSHTGSDATAGAGAAATTAASDAPGRMTTGAGRVGGTADWLVAGSGITTGPTEGVGMNGVLLSGRAVLPTVADPALMAARIGMDAVPASRATVKR
ncbi:hypothetical protein [Micromonospora inositola]|uniref:Uncharacterized protein n=1 Tax=Micromonospora inositola TaxID=47865 RepID=A0A1C5HSQ9_9ACTN|nr:hypothetical protein [Micromonospora inositola]SCG48957.1 hypothetical protein GA0070613_1749 [Micromonospora inositola]